MEGAAWSRLKRAACSFAVEATKATLRRSSRLVCSGVWFSGRPARASSPYAALEVFAGGWHVTVYSADVRVHRERATPWAQFSERDSGRGVGGCKWEVVTMLARPQGPLLATHPREQQPWL